MKDNFDGTDLDLKRSSMQIYLSWHCKMLKSLWSLLFQVNCSHNATAPKQYPAVVSVSVSQGNKKVISLSGTVAAGKPVLTAVNDAALGQGALLEGNVVLYRAEANGKVLTSITGMYNM